MKRIIFFISCISFIYCSTKSNSNKTSSLPTKKSVAGKKLDPLPIISKVTGGWCCNVKDSMDFSITLVVKSDSIFGEYSNTMFNGKYLNTDDDQKIWAFKIPYTDIVDISKYFPITNFYDNSIAHLKFEFDEKNDVLIWELQENDDSIPFLPHYAKLHRCKGTNIDRFQ